MKVKVLSAGVTVENAVLDVGAVVDVSDKDASRLVEYGFVEIVNEPEAPTEAPTEDQTEDQPEPKKSTRSKKTE